MHRSKKDRNNREGAGRWGIEHYEQILGEMIVNRRR